VSDSPLPSLPLLPGDCAHVQWLFLLLTGLKLGGNLFLYSFQVYVYACPLHLSPCRSARNVRD
jgi:hypothetical protein